MDSQTDRDMGTRVCLFIRCSTIQQNTERQWRELRQYCENAGWEIVKAFENKISGGKKNEERPEVMEMINYVKENKIDKVVCLSIDRLGRNVAEASKIISFLIEQKVSLFIVNYGLETLKKDGTVNPMATFLCNLLLSVAEWEKMNIAERFASGRNTYIAKCRETGKKMGRPDTYRKTDEEYKAQYAKEINLLKRGYSLRNTQKLTGTSIGTLRKLGKYL